MKINDSYNDTFLEVENSYLDSSLKKASLDFNNKIAVQTLDEKISYGELYEEALKLSRRFDFQHQPIAIIGYRDIKTIIQIYAVLMSNNYYIPIDPEYPEGRKQYILDKSAARMLLDGDVTKEIRKSSTTVPFKDKIKTSDKIAYIIFTSGSTGEPKGVVETHYQVWNTLIDLKKRLNLSSKDNFLGLASFSFDLSVFDIFASSMVGGTLYIVKDQRDSREIENLLSNQQVSVWNSVPGVLNSYLRSNSQAIRNLNLRVCLLSGDYVSKDLVEWVQGELPECKILSLGGATECSIWSILFEVNKNNIKEIDYIPYGYPMANQQVYILDDNNNIIRNHTVGQIAVGGAGVSLGYIDDIDRTNEAFIQHPEIGYLYLTGDLGELFYPNYIKFMGRKETQIKVNGYRVSFSEVSRVFRNCFKFECVTFSFKDKEKIDKIVLVYFSEYELSEKVIRDCLKLKLAKYEVPHYIFNMKKAPLTSNGKVDLTFLKNITIEKINSLHKLNTKCLEVETPLRKVLKEILKINNISSDTSLFSLGIDSLKMVRIKNWALDELGLEIELVDIYNCDTIRDIERLLSE